VTVADIDQNGRPDLIVAHSGSNTVSVLLINTTASGSIVPSFAPHQNFAAENGPVSVTSADLNGGKAGLAVANQSANIVSVLLNHRDKAVISGSPPNRNNSLPELTSSPRAVSCSSYNIVVYVS